MSARKIIFLLIGIACLIVFFSVGVVVFLAKPNLEAMTARARLMKAESDLKMLEASLIRYQVTAQLPPSQEQGLSALVEKPVVEPVPQRWRQLLMADALIDPWGNPYQYRYPSTMSSEKYDLWSLGPDGVESDDDIGNW